MDYEEIVSMSQRRVTITISAPLSIVEVIDRIAEHESVAASKVLLRLIRLGMAVERDARAASKKR